MYVADEGPLGSSGIGEAIAKAFADAGYNVSERYDTCAYSDFGTEHSLLLQM
jgi:hypothetical protein